LKFEPVVSMQPKHALIGLAIIFAIFLEIWEPEASKGIVRVATRILILLISCAFLYQSYDAFRTLRESKEPGGNIGWGTIALALGAFGIFASLSLI
jgi:hypothetical protein